MESQLVTTGEFANLAATTKRTILFYAELGLLKPAKVNSSGYRYYLESQVLDFQRILLLSTLGVPLSEMTKSGNLVSLFESKKSLIEQEIRLLEFNLRSLTKFLKNLTVNGTMVSPKIKTMRPFGIYFIDQEGSYAKIGRYCHELASMFETTGKNFTTLAVFPEQGYRPKKSKIIIGAVATNGMKIKASFRQTIKYMKFNPGKVLTYTHNGPGNLLSLFWKELEKYCWLHKIKIRQDTTCFEIYHQVNSDPTRQFFDIYLPIR